MGKWVFLDHGWLDRFWFTPSTLNQLHWARGYVLWGIALVPLLFVLRYLLFYRYRQRIDLTFPLFRVTKDPTSLLRFVPMFLLASSLTCLLLALARPQRLTTKRQVISEGIDLVLLLDVSESMGLQDFEPDRLTVAKQLAAEFIAKRRFDRLGLVAFAGIPMTLAPLTDNHATVLLNLSSLSPAMLDAQGTAIGNAVAVGINRLQAGKAKSKAMVLISDGDNTAGNIDPHVAGLLAQEQKIKIYTIALGRDGKVKGGIDEDGKPFFVNNVLNENTLRDLAQTTQGRFFRCPESGKLPMVFDEIDKLEKTPLITRTDKTSEDVYPVYIIWAAVFMLSWLLSKATFLANAMED